MVESERRVLTLGTRGSKLALVQAEMVRAALAQSWPDIDVRVEIITTKGDAIQDKPLSQIGGNGVFVRQIEMALESGQVDIAVHSAKDLPSALSGGMVIGGYLPRADARDVLVSAGGKKLMELPAGARVGTSSPRRACQIRGMRPDLELLDIRGNVDTRLRKLSEGQYDAIALAAAGLERLGLLDRVSEWFEPDVMIPAIAQGAIALEVREADLEVRQIVAALNDQATWVAVTAERAFLTRVGGSCALPVAAHAIVEGEQIRIEGAIGSNVDTQAQMVRGSRIGPVEDPAGVGAALAEDLLAMGGLAFVAQSFEQVVE